MKAEYINSFLMECKNIFSEMAGIDLNYVGTTLKKSTVQTRNVVVVIGITGDLKGSVLINLDNNFAKKIASNMMGGMEVKELDELSKSAIAELGNMTMGRVTTALASMGLSTDITPPSVMTGEDIVLSASVAPFLSIKFSYGEYVLDFDISIKENNK